MHKHLAVKSETVSQPELHRLLRRQLRKLGLKPGAGPTPSQWQDFIDRVSRCYDESDSDRAMLTRTLELTTEEMDGLRGQAEADRDRLRDLLDAVGTGIGYFAKSVDGNQVCDFQALNQARTEFVNYIETILYQDADTDAQSFVEEKKVRDEFVNLADSVIFLVQEAATAGKLQNQMELAGTIQRLMVPADGVIEGNGLSVSSVFRPATYCGGDWWSIHRLDPQRTMIVVGDVTGHGVASAVMAGAAKGACDAIAAAGPAAIMTAIHQLMVGPEEGRLAMTCAIAIIDNAQETIELTNAGHPFPLVVSSDGSVSPLIARGDPLGIMPTFSAATIVAPMHQGDSLLFYTDGITECANGSGQQFGDRRLRRILRDRPRASAEALVDAIITTVDEHRGNAEPDDDLTLIVAQRT